MPAAPFVEPPASRPAERVADALACRARRRRQHDARRAGVDDDRDPIVARAELVGEQRQRRA